MTQRNTLPAETAVLTSRSFRAVLVGLVLVASVTVTGIGAVRARDADVERAETARRITRAAADISQDLSSAIRDVDDAAASVVDGGPARLRDFAVSDGTALEWVPVGRRSVADPALEAAFDDARDTGDLILTAPIGDPPEPRLVRAVYAGDGALTLRPTAKATDRRRAEIAGHVVATVAAVGDPARRDPLGGLDWQLRDGSILLAGSEPGGLTGPVVDTDVQLLDRQWVLRASVPGAPVPASVVAIAILGLLATAGLFTALVQVRRTGRHRRADAVEAHRLAGSITGMSRVVRQTHDLASILPALAVQLSDELGLAGVSLAVVEPDGVEREVFGHGARPRSSTPIHEVDDVEAGRSFHLQLLRGDRTIARLGIVTGRDLADGDLELLQVAAEIITSAVVTNRSLEQQQDAVARLRALDELKTAFLGTASHELRTPVTAISGFASVLESRWDSFADEERRVFVERIASNARSLDALVQDLLDFARLERGHHGVAVDDVVLSAVVDRVLDRLAPVWASHRVERLIAPEVVVRGDAAAIERVITNLVSNAVKFSPERSTVRVSVVDAVRPRLLVEDEGPGVPVDEREKIFIRFMRGRGEAVLRTRGVGIGLAVVDDFMGRMGGGVWVESGPRGIGSRFVAEFVGADVRSSLGAGESEEHDAAPT